MGAKDRQRAAGGLVYSTESGRMCPACRRPLAQCECSRRTSTPAGDGIARVSRQTKGRGGKTVTVVEGTPLDPIALASLAKQLKAACGVGGTVKDGSIELQGDHCERALEFLQRAGLKAKRTGR